MAFFKAIWSAFRNYFTIRGRANRREFWFWLAFVVIAWYLLRLADLYYIAPMRGFLPYEEGAGYWASNGFLVLCIIPTITLIVRRMHDHDRSGWWALTVLPAIWWLIAKGDKQENRFG